MGNSASQPDARSLRAELEGLSIVEQHKYAYHWALSHDCVIDLFGDYAREHHFTIFRSGNESENWIDKSNRLVYKMNTLMHVGEDIAKLLLRMELFNLLFPHNGMTFVGFYVYSETHVNPVFTQPFIDRARFATNDEIASYLELRGFYSTGNDGEYSDGEYLISDARPKNVLVSESQAIFIIDADIVKL
ncbi:MAG: hypothetical protein ACI4BD_03815 [Paludibacteraceae bacterium]